MSDIKAIETQYKGYRFRSRLEARWAIFFDAMGIVWEYESEGYQLSDGTRYLPDFWLPEGQVFAEIKGRDFLDDEIRKCEVLASQADKTVLMLVGPPQCNTERIEVIGVAVNNQGRFSICQTSSAWVIVDEIQTIGKADTRQAATAARSARFEHGEKPVQSEQPNTRPTIDDSDSVARMEVRAMEERITELERIRPLASMEEKKAIDVERVKIILQMRASGKASFKAFRRKRAEQQANGVR